MDIPQHFSSINYEKKKKLYIHQCYLAKQIGAIKVRRQTSLTTKLTKIKLLDKARAAGVWN